MFICFAPAIKVASSYQLRGILNPPGCPFRAGRQRLVFRGSSRKAGGERMAKRVDEEPEVVLVHWDIMRDPYGYRLVG